MTPIVDINETSWFRQDSSLMEILLKDHTTHKNIFWATDSYVSKGEGYEFHDEITIERITSDNEGLIRPRCVKSKDEQMQRTKEKAEVFTPSWLCNKQNNLVDNEWFGREDVFNTEIDEEKTHTWVPTKGKILFSKDITWQEYIRATRMEITCGEAPYLASRYDTITGNYIPIENRIGLLDRKLRVVGENTETKDEWLKMAILSYQNIYGFEWQGDNILLARESLLMTFIEFYQAKFNETPPHDALKQIALIISWNIWQMDGLKMVVPMSCHEIKDTQTSFFDVMPQKPKPCPGCKNNDIFRHNGIYCDIMDWEAGHTIKFYTLIHESK